MFSDEMYLILKDACKKGQAISVFFDKNQPDECYVGIIERITPDQLVIKHISPEGLYDGYVIRKTNDIFRVDINGQYEKRVNSLYELQGQMHKKLLDDENKTDGNLLVDALIAAKKLNLVVNVCIDETEEQENIVGWVKKINKTIVTISQISYDGLDDGESHFYIDDIIYLNCDSADERIFGMLSAKQKKRVRV